MADSMRNAINWFQIPSSDYGRATKFYESILGVTMHRMPMGDSEMAFLPADDGKVGGAIVFHKDAKPSADGTMVFLNANPDLADILRRIEKAGGKIIVPKTHINSEIGYFAIFLDTEGNRVGLHSQN
jgi:predicted enzyme related to lactoylglutathione lyase